MSLSTAASSRIIKPFIVLICLAVIAAVLWQLLPKASFSSDMSQVGQGKPALVMLREVHVLGGELVMDQMLAVYPEFENDMVFLVVHTGHPDGQQFANTHNIRDGSLVLFDPQGRPLGVSGRPDNINELRLFIRQNLHN
jgi:hypothetical protein